MRLINIRFAILSFDGVAQYSSSRVLGLENTALGAGTYDVVENIISRCQT